MLPSLVVPKPVLKSGRLFAPMNLGDWGRVGTNRFCEFPYWITLGSYGSGMLNRDSIMAIEVRIVEAGRHVHKIPWQPQFRTNWSGDSAHGPYSNRENAMHLMALCPITLTAGAGGLGSHFNSPRH